MVIAVKGYSTSLNNSVAVPSSGIATGDLLILAMSSYNVAMTGPAGWTKYGTTVTGTGSWNEYLTIYYLVATSTMTGNITTSSGQPSYMGTVLLVITGHDATSPMNAFISNASTSDTNTLSTSAITTTAQGRIFYFGSNMAGNGVTSTLSVSGQASTLITNANQPTYHSFTSYINNNTSIPPTTNYSGAVISATNAGPMTTATVAVKDGNSAPSVSNITPNATAQDPRSPVTVSWTYSDTENNAQNAYQIQYRVRGSTGAYTTVSGTTATSHTFAANTFTLGTEYEYQVRVSDASAGYGAWSNTQWFMAGTDVWDYGPEVTSSSSSAQSFIQNTYSTTFEADNGTFSPNTFFGTYTDPTSWGRTTTRPKTGSYSMEITWPTGNESRLVTNGIPGHVVGAWYALTADIYVPSGSVDVSLDPFLQDGGGNQGWVWQKDTWVTRTAIFRATATNPQFAIKTFNGSPVSGQKCFIDNVTVAPVAPPNSGQYIVQVRTADNGGAWGPWSASSEFTITREYARSNGILVPAARYVMDGGVVKIAKEHTYSDIVLEDNPMGYWKLDDTTSGIALDSSGYQKHGTHINSPGLSASGPGSSRSTQFTRASSQYIRIPTNSFPLGNSSYTLEAWINATQIDANQGIITNGRFDNNNQSNSVRLHTGNGIYNYWWGSGAYDFFASSGLIVPNSWLHVVATYDGANRRIYINGQLIGTGASSNLNANTVLTTISTIGRTYSNEYFNGNMAHVAVYDTALSQARVSAHYAAMK